MFTVEKTSHLNLVAAFRLYYDLLKRYYNKMLRPDTYNELFPAWTLLHQARAYLLTVQKERAPMINEMRQEFDSWDTERLLTELHERVADYRAFPFPFFEEGVTESDEVNDKHSIHYIYTFLEPIRDEGRYIIGWIKELTVRLGDQCPKEYERMRFRATIEPVTHSIESQEELLQFWEEKKQEYTGEREQLWLEQICNTALKCRQGDKKSLFYDQWIDYYWG
jgi:hypothetical protein